MKGNFYNLNGSPDALGVSYLQALALMTLFGNNLTQVTGANASVDINGYLPFSLSNVDNSNKNYDQLSYNTGYQEVNEYSDRPYPVRGLVCFAIGTSVIEKDLDNFVKFTVYDAEALVNKTVYIGVVNSSQTDFYTPLAGAVAVYYQKPKNFSLWELFGDSANNESDASISASFVQDFGGTRPAVSVTMPKLWANNAKKGLKGNFFKR